MAGLLDIINGDSIKRIKDLIWKNNKKMVWLTKAGNTKGLRLVLDMNLIGGTGFIFDTILSKKRKIKSNLENI